MKWNSDHLQQARSFLSVLKTEGFNFFTGVPCSLLGAFIDGLSSDAAVSYFPAVREDAAVGMASGAFLAGRLPVVFMQNSGLGYSLNVFTSLNLIYKIPMLCVVSFRGFGPDAPEHLVMGKTCVDLLDTIGIPSFVPESGDLLDTLKRAKTRMVDQRVPVALFIKKGIFGA